MSHVHSVVQVAIGAFLLGKSCRYASIIETCLYIATSPSIFHPNSTIVQLHVNALLWLGPLRYLGDYPELEQRMIQNVSHTLSQVLHASAVNCVQNLVPKTYLNFWSNFISIANSCILLSSICEKGVPHDKQ